jgi:hypothetical protein
VVIAATHMKRCRTRKGSSPADSGVALTVLTATDLYLGGRHADHNVPRNVVDLNRLAETSYNYPPVESSLADVLAKKW